MKKIVMKKIGICGDSFMASTRNNDESICGEHFTDLLAEKLNCELVTFARSAASNEVIRLQIDEIIKFKPDLIIIDSTTPDRIEVPIYENKEFDKDKGIYNMDYRNYSNNKSSIHSGFIVNRPSLLTNTLSNHIKSGLLDKEKEKSIYRFIGSLYDERWEAMKDSWVLAEGLRKLDDLNIDYYFILNGLLNEEVFYFCADKTINTSNGLSPFKYFKRELVSLCPHHLLKEHQIILADLWYDFLKNKINVKRNII